MSGEKISYRYSQTFREKVLKEIRVGTLSVSEASKIYQVTVTSIYGWLKKAGYSPPQCEVKYVTLKDKDRLLDKLKKQERYIKELESALASSHIKNMALESLLEVTEEKYGIKVKKNSGTKESATVSIKPDHPE